MIEIRLPCHYSAMSTTSPPPSTLGLSLSPIVTRLDPSPILSAVAHALRVGAMVARADAGVIDLVGSGAVACMQGLLTNDVEKSGDGAFIYGALLTPKGMILTDGWVTRNGDTVRMVVPGAGRERTLGVLLRSVPPRLARVTDRTADLVVLRVAGVHALALAGAAQLPLPPGPGRALKGPDGEVARGPEDVHPPFALQLVADPAHADDLTAQLTAGGAVLADSGALELARILAGWPGLASEVDEKTIPQEVRFDEIGGLSYTKGCYTGQETVSRLHFRGHANRALLGLEFDGEPDRRDPLPVLQADKEVGRASSVAWVPDAGPSGPAAGRWMGLAILRREVEPGSMVRAGGVDARVVALPLRLRRHEPA